MLSGDIIPLEVDSDNDISSIKVIIKDMNNIESLSLIKLFNMDGDELENGDKIKDKIQNEDMINVFIEALQEPPFKGEKWIYFKTTDEKVQPPLKKYFKKINPVFKTSGWANVSQIKKYEGNIDEFIGYDDNFISKLQISHLEKFRKTIKDLGFDDLIYVYVVYTNAFIHFIATNYDSSIVYEYDRNTVEANNYVYINGIRIRLISDWFKWSDEKRLELLRM